VTCLSTYSVPVYVAASRLVCGVYQSVFVAILLCLLPASMGAVRATL